MTARDYRVTFGYGAVDGVYYVPGRPHRGTDRPTPAWTPVVIGGTTIGYTGATGLVSGPHLHIQAGRDDWAQQTINPEPYAFKGGKVVRTGNASQWGNYVCIKVGDVFVYYCHLARISASAGEVITVPTGGGDTVDKTDLTAIYELGPLNRKRNAGEGEDVYLGKSAAFVLRDHAKSAEAKRKASARASEISNLKAKLSAMTRDRDAWKAKAGTGTADPATTEAASKWNQLKKMLGIK